MSRYGRLWECGKDPFSLAQRQLHEDPQGRGGIRGTLQPGELPALKSSLTAAGGYKTLSKDPGPSLGPNT